MSEPQTADLATRARYRQEGADYERERIIKLLEETKQKTATSMDADSNYYAGLVQAIALIKGEK